VVVDIAVDFDDIVEDIAVDEGIIVEPVLAFEDIDAEASFAGDDDIDTIDEIFAGEDDIGIINARPFPAAEDTDVETDFAAAVEEEIIFDVVGFIVELILDVNDEGTAIE